MLKLPATDAWLTATCRRLQVNAFCEIELTDLECAIPDLDDLLPQDCISVGDTNKLALAIQEMQQTDGELLKYLSVLSIEQPKDFPDALRLALELDNYERVPSAPEEYGKEVLGRIGGEDAVEAVDGYMNFQCFGEDMMAEDGVHPTEFGAVRRLNDPSSQQGQTFQ